MRSSISSDKENRKKYEYNEKTHKKKLKLRRRK